MKKQQVKKGIAQLRKRVKQYRDKHQAKLDARISKWQARHFKHTGENDGNSE